MATPEPTPDTETDPRARGSARQAILLMLATLGLLVLFAGDSIDRQGRELDEGPIRSVVLAVGGPTGAIADALPFAPVADAVGGWISSEDDLGTEGGSFSAPAAGVGTERIPPAAFSADRTPLRRLLVTGDSMSQPLDAVLARRTEDQGVRTVRDAKVGTGISKTDLVDWGRLSGQQIAEFESDAVVVFLGANEGFPMPIDGRDVECCSVDWAAEYATRTRAIINAYRSGGARRIYWLTLPAPREQDRAEVTGTVNRAIRVAAAGFGETVQLVDAAELFSPGFAYRDAMEVDGRERLVRDPDGIHLNDEGAEVLADRLLERIGRDFTLGGGAG